MSHMKLRKLRHRKVKAPKKARKIARNVSKQVKRMRRAVGRRPKVRGR